MDAYSKNLQGRLEHTFCLTTFLISVLFLFYVDIVKSWKSLSLYIMYRGKCPATSNLNPARSHGFAEENYNFETQDQFVSLYRYLERKHNWIVFKPVLQQDYQILISRWYPVCDSD